jgi:hypothetical protein
MEEEAPNKRNEVAILSDHVLVLILSHLTARSFCSCKCVCCSWNSLISVSGYRKELLKILVGFFYCSWKCKCNFTSVNGEYPSLSFLPFSIQDVMISDYSQGLILFWYSGFYYVVCNPVTKKWLLLSGSNHSCGSARLGFDPTVSSHLHVFEYRINDDDFLGVNIYSSKIRA